MHPLATYLTAARSMTDHDLDDDDLRAWSRGQANPARAETPAPWHRRIASILQLRSAFRARRSARGVGRSA